MYIEVRLTLKYIIDVNSTQVFIVVEIPNTRTTFLSVFQGKVREGAEMRALHLGRHLRGQVRAVHLEGGPAQRREGGRDHERPQESQAPPALRRLRERPQRDVPRHRIVS